MPRYQGIFETKRFFGGSTGMFSETTAILVDGAFYRRRSYYLFGEKNPKQRANELVQYCQRHLKGTSEQEDNHLYRIFYYDCPSIGGNLYHNMT